MRSDKAQVKSIFEMGTYEMRFLMLESVSGNQIKLKKCMSVDTPRDFVASTFLEHPIIEPEPIKRAATSLIKQAKISYENVLLMVPDHFALFNLIITPSRYTRKEAEETVKEDLEPILPLPLSNWHFVYNTIGSWETDEIILALAVIKNNLIEAGGLIQSSGVNPVHVDINFLNVANLAESYLTQMENKGKNICLVHLGHESTTVGVFRDGQLRTVQNRPIGAYDFTRQLSRHFHVPEAEADKFKRNETFFLPEQSPEQDALYNYTVIKNIFSILIREIFGTIENYLTKFREFSVHEIIISGGGANFEHINVALSSNLNTTVKPISDLYSLEVAGNQLDAQNRNSMAAACGCFLRN